jgi:hypothetical protein
MFTPDNSIRAKSFKTLFFFVLTGLSCQIASAQDVFCPQFANMFGNPSSPQLTGTVSYVATASGSGFSLQATISGTVNQQANGLSKFTGKTNINFQEATADFSETIVGSSTSASVSVDLNLACVYQFPVSAIIPVVQTVDGTASSTEVEIDILPSLNQFEPGLPLTGLILNGSGIISGSVLSVPVIWAVQWNFSVIPLPLTMFTSGLPEGFTGVGYETTSTPANQQALIAFDGTNPYTWTASGLPNGLSVDKSTGLILGIPSQAGTFTVTVKLTDAKGSTIVKVFPLTIIAFGFTITTQSLPSGTVGSPYPLTTLAATGGTPPYSWSASGLPAGLTADPKTGVISGIPTTGGSLTVNVHVTDSAAGTASKSFTITVTSNLAIATQQLPNGTVDASYLPTMLAATGGAAPYSWSISGLPAGLNIDSKTGIISGSPTTAGNFTAIVQVNDSASQTASKSLLLTVSPRLQVITPTLLPSGNVNEKYSGVNLQASGGVMPYSWSVSGLPPGLAFNVEGAIFGTPTVSNIEFPTLPADLNPFQVHVIVTDEAGNMASRNLLLNITDVPNTKFKTDQEANAFLVLAIEYSAAAVAAFIASNFPACRAIVICSQIMEAQFEGFAGLSIKYYKAALDPADPNYTSVAYPVSAALTLLSLQTGISQADVQGLNPLLVNFEQEIGLTQALVTAINRAQGASHAGNLFWESEQLQAASSFATRLANLLNQNGGLRSTAANTLQIADADPQIEAGDVQNFIEGLGTSGLPFSAVQELLNIGLAAPEIIAFSTKIIPLFSAQDATGLYSSILVGTKLASTEAGATSALTSFANLNSISQFQMGDVNGDSRVNCTDLSIVKASFGKISSQIGFDPRADVNKDGVVNILDLSIVAKGIPSGTVCE